MTGAPLTTQRPATELAAGRIQLAITFEAAPGRKLDDRFGPSTSLTVTASPPELLAAGTGDTVELDRLLELRPGRGVLHVTAQAASCDADGVENPACYLARQDWGVPVRVADTGDSELRLVLLG